MRVLSIIVSAAAFIGAFAAPEALRGDRSLYVANYGGEAFNGRYPVNACFNFQRYPTPEFSDCDGMNAAQAFCKKEGYARVLSFKITRFADMGVPSSYCMGTGNVVEAGIHTKNHQVVTEVQCDQV